MSRTINIRINNFHPQCQRDLFTFPCAYTKLQDI